MWLTSDPVTLAGLTAPGYVFLLGTGAAVLASLVVLRQIMLPRPIPGIPYNEHATRRIMGDLPDMLAHPNRRQWIVDQAKKHQAPLMQFFLSPFRPPAVFVFDHREAQNLSVRRIKEFDRGSTTRHSFGIAIPNQILCLPTHSAQYKHNMRLIRDLMTPTFLREVSAPHIYEKVRWVLSLWDGKVAMAGGRAFDGTADVHHAALDMIMGASFGFEKSQSMLQTKLDHLARAGVASSASPTAEVVEFEDPPLLEELQACTTMADAISLGFKSPLPWLNTFVYRNLVPSYRRALAVSQRMAKREIAKSVERLHTGHPQRCAMDQMLEREEALAKKEGRQPDYFSDVIKDELLGYLIAGFETTSSALQWGLKYLTTDQRVQAKMRATCHAAFPEAKAEGRLPTIEEITAPQVRMPYIDACMQEIVRHARPLALMQRETVVETELLGVRIPRGVNIGFTSNGPGYMSAPLHVDEEKRHETARASRDRTGAPEPATLGTFWPERWITTTDDGEEEFDARTAPFLSFGEGPRMCFGKKLALLEMRIFYILVLWHFELRPVPPACETEEEALFLTRIPKHAWLRLENIRYEKA